MIGITRRRIPPTEDECAYVDLGLPSGLLWAQGNIVKDANGVYAIGEPTDYGCYFSWGNIIGHNNGDGYNFSSSVYSSTPGASVNKNISPTDAQHDAALACLGSPWHMPTSVNFKELYDNTDREFTTIDGINGWKFMKKTDHSVYVFFPLAGYGDGTRVVYVGSYGYYRSLTWRKNNTAYCMYFSSSSVIPQDYSDRYFGFPIRAVRSA